MPSEPMEDWSHHSRCADCGCDLDVCDCGSVSEPESEPQESAEREW